MKKRIERKRDLIQGLKKGVVGLGLVGVLGVTGVVGNNGGATVKAASSLLDVNFKADQDFTLNKPVSIVMGEGEVIDNLVNRELEDLEIKVTAKKGSDPNNVVLLEDGSNHWNYTNVRVDKVGTYYLSIKEKSTGAYPKLKKKSVKRVTLNVKKAPTKIVCTKKKVKIKKGTAYKVNFKYGKGEAWYAPALLNDTGLLSGGVAVLHHDTVIIGMGKGKETVTTRTPNGVQTTFELEVYESKTKK